MKQSKSVYIIGSIVIGIITIIAVLAGLVLSGIIDASSKKLVFTSESREIIYNGNVLTCEGWKLESGELKEGHTARVTIAGRQNEVGSSQNNFAVAIFDENQADVTADYEITTIPGTLTVLQRPIFLESEDAVEEYNGEALKNETASVVAGELLEGHTVEYIFTGARTDAGESENTFIAIIKNAKGVDVTKNYALSYSYGELEVLPMEVAIESGDRNVEYNGQPIDVSNDAWDYVDQQKRPLAHHQVRVKFSGSQTEVGVSEKKLASVVVTDGDRDVSFNYNFTYTGGKINVKAREITIKSKGKEKIYDGTPLTFNEYEITQGGLGEGHQITAIEITGEQTEVGSSPNTIIEGSVVICDADGFPVTENYKITLEEGTLLVNMGENIGDDDIVDDFSNIPDDMLNAPVAYVTSASDELLYLRRGSYHNYNGSINWSDAPVYTEYLNGNYSMNYLVGAALRNRSLPVRELEIRVLYKQVGYILPYYQDVLQTNVYRIQSSDVMNDYPLNDSSYYASYYNQPIENLYAGYLDAYEESESYYRIWVNATYKSLPTSTLSAVKQVIDSKGWKRTDADIISKVASYVQSLADYDVSLGKKSALLDAEPDVVKAMLNNRSKPIDEQYQAICSHYATTGVAIFRALGMPARYTTGYMVETTAGVETAVLVKNGHAWVEVYLNGIGWVYVECTASANGTGTTPTPPVSTKYALEVTPIKDVVQYYNGVYHDPKDEVSISTPANSGYAWETFEAQGYYYKAVVTGSRMEPGTGVTEVDSFVVFNAQDEDVTDQFIITKKKGKIQVYMYTIYITTYSDSKVYDGQALTQSKYNVTGDIFSDFNYEITCTGSRVSVGSSYNTVGVKITQLVAGTTDDWEDVTDWFNVVVTYGKLTITARAITIQACSKVEEYVPGTTLECKQYVIIGELIDGHEVLVTFDGELTSVGTAVNRIKEVKISDTVTGKSVTRQYSIKVVDGMLEFLPPTV